MRSQSWRAVRSATLRAFALLLPLGAAAAPAYCQDSPEQAPSAEDVKALFIATCAACHGETGDGKGTTQLDRPARSFKDGGFSYGNTPTALFRTLSTGIPGTPMPSFDGALTADQMRALATYVIELGPDQAIAESPKRHLVVAERPMVVRGLLPPVTGGAAQTVRGLLVGLPSGMTFEYDVDDVRLLGVRQGDFVERRDWVGRGGTALKPLGKVVHVFEGGKPGPAHKLIAAGSANSAANAAARGQEPSALKAQFTGSWIQEGRAGVHYDLVGEHGEIYSHVRDWCTTRKTSVATGWVRHIHWEAGNAAGRVLIKVGDDFRPEQRVAMFNTVSSGGGRQYESWLVLKRDDGVFKLIGMRKKDKRSLIFTSSMTNLWVDFRPGKVASVELTTILLSEWSADIQAKLMEELTQ